MNLSDNLARISKGKKSYWLMCEPEFFEVTYEINPWMSLDAKPNLEQAKLQWSVLKETIEATGAGVETISHVAGLPDMVFTANGGLVHNRRSVIPNFYNKERQPETEHFDRWFRAQGFETLVPRNAFEAAGDGLFAGDCLLLGYGPRSSFESHAEVSEFLEVEESLSCELVDQRFYHLDTCLCPLSESEVMLFPKAFTPSTLKQLGERFDILEISEAEACNFACNSVVLGEAVVMPAAGRQEDSELLTALRNRGKTVHQVDLSEFLKAGGAAKCLSLQIG